MYEYIRSCKVKDLPVCAQKEVNVRKSMSAGIQVSRSCGMYGIHDSMKRRGLPDGKDYGQQKYTGSNTSRASRRGWQKEREGYRMLLYQLPTNWGILSESGATEIFCSSTSTSSSNWTPLCGCRNCERGRWMVWATMTNVGMVASSRSVPLP